MLSVPINVATSGDSPLVAGVAGKRIMPIHFDFMAGGTVNVYLRDGPGGPAFTGPYPLTAQAGISASAPAQNERNVIGLFAGTAGTALTINLSANVQVSGLLTYELIP